MAERTKQLVQDLLKAFNIQEAATKVNDNALKLLSDDSTVRTNQSQVQDHLNGLVEKSWILNKGQFGDALQQRLDQIPNISNQWTPDVLSFLLALSDRPVQNTRIQDLGSLISDTPTAPPTWKDILEEDPLEDQTAIWRDIDFAADDSDEDEDAVSLYSKSSEDEKRSSLSETEITETNLESLIVSIDKSAVDKIVDAQSWRKDAAIIERPRAGDSNVFEIREIAAIREVIFMLLGLPTSIFEKDGNGTLRLRRRIKFCHTSSDSVTHLINSLLDLGQKLSSIRSCVGRHIAVPLEQAFQSALESRLLLFQSRMHNIQKTILDPHLGVVSLIDVSDQVLGPSRPIVTLHSIVEEIKAFSESQRPFKTLEILYSQVCEYQKIGEEETYECLARVFFECFQIYLRPIQAWMETGQADSNNPVMFIALNEGFVPLESLWQDQYRLLHSEDGSLKAPQFLHLAGKRIFNTGKSVYFLRKLGIHVSKQDSETSTRCSMSYETVCSAADARLLLPFPELFDMALGEWITSRHRSSSAVLRRHLELHCGLKRALMALDYIYLYFNGALSSSIVRPLFEKIERGKQLWNDSYTTTELLQEAFAAVDCVDIDRLSSRPTVSKHTSNIKQRSMDVLEKIDISYALPWPVANIIRPESIATYRCIFVLLSQFERARFLLQRNKLPVNAPQKFFAIHNHLLWFINTMFSHLTTLVIAVNTKNMHQDMTDAEDVDALIAVHQAYVSKLEDQCFLSKRHTSLHRAMVSILDLAVLLSDLHASTASNGQSRSRSVSSSEDEEQDARPSLKTNVTNDTGIEPLKRLTSINETYSQLLAIVTATVEGISKAEGGTVWTILASHLGFGAAG